VVKCPACGREFPEDYTFCPHCGLRLHAAPPMVMAAPSGLSFISRAAAIFSKNLILCVPQVVEMGILFLMGILAGFVIVAMVIGLACKDMNAIARVGLLLGISLGVASSFLSNLIGGWQTAASVQVFLLGRVVIGGAALRMVLRRFWAVIYASAILLFISSPFWATALYWVAVAPIFAVRLFETYVRLLIDVPSEIISLFLLFFIPLVVVTDWPVTTSLKRSVSMVAEAFSMDPTYLIAVFLVNLALNMAAYIPTVGEFLAILTGLVWGPILKLSVVLYLTARFEVPFKFPPSTGSVEEPSHEGESDRGM